MTSWAFLFGLGPQLLVYLIGIGLCFRHAGDQRRRAIAAGLAMTMMLFNMAVSLTLGSWLFSNLQDRFEIELASLLHSLIYSLTSSVALLLLLWAVFYGAENHEPDDIDDEPNS